MKKENAEKLWKIIQETGDYLRSQRDTLPHTSSHQLALDPIQIVSQKEITIVEVDYGQRKTRPETRSS